MLLFDSPPIYHLSLIIHHFPVDISALKPIMLPVCIGTHSADAGGQVSPKDAAFLLCFFSLFKIQNSQFAPPLQSGPIKNESGKIVVKQGKK
jgi:hypothetical protein